MTTCHFCKKDGLQEFINDGSRMWLCHDCEIVLGRGPLAKEQLSNWVARGGGRFVKTPPGFDVAVKLQELAQA